MSLTRDQFRQVQQALNNKGFTDPYGQPLVVDGLPGPKTSFAIIEFKKSVGLAARDYVGPITFEELTGHPLQGDSAPPPDYAPWYAEMLKYIGKTEFDLEIAAWLASDGATVGDPAEVPWCGDAVQTAFANTLPTEPLPENPYLAANWATWGDYVAPQMFCVLSFWRGSPDNWQGHVGLYAGESDENFYVLGGNQSNSVNMSPISKTRLRDKGSRWPSLKLLTPSGATKRMTGGTVSTNEA